MGGGEDESRNKLKERAEKKAISIEQLQIKLPPQHEVKSGANRSENNKRE